LGGLESGTEDDDIDLVLNTVVVDDAVLGDLADAVGVHDDVGLVERTEVVVGD
jgi:hypothetical protein